jgi:predicted AlkP superfamily phosphohydrolase/phosphomutase
MVENALILGFDGLDPILVSKYINDMPNIRKIIENGVFGKMETTIPPVTPGAWTGIVTGLNPGKTGILGFHIKEGYKFESVNTIKVTYKKMWDILKERGIRSGLINLPLPGKLEPVKDFNISGRFLALLTYPDRLKAELLSKGYTSEIYNYKDFSTIKEFKKSMFEVADVRTRCSLELFDKYKPEFKMVVYNLPDTLHHFLDNEDDINELYIKIDEITGSFLNEYRNLIIVSDHGFTKSPPKGTIYLGEWLKKEGFIKVRHEVSDVTQSKLRWFRREKILRILRTLHLEFLKKIVPKSFKDIVPMYNPPLIKHTFDWKNTKVLMDPSCGCIYLNIKGREPQGCLSEKEVNKFFRILKRKLESLSYNGEKLGIKVYKNEEIYNGDNISKVADIVYTDPKDWLTSDRLNKGDIFSSNHRFQRTHDTYAVFIARGKHIKKNYKIKNISIYDIVPTVMYIMDLDIPDYFDGNVVEEIFETQYFKRKPPTLYSSNGQKVSIENGSELTEEEQKEFEKRLKGMGYL